jgi:hypothetical protein
MKDLTQGVAPPNRERERERERGDRNKKREIILVR